MKMNVNTKQIKNSVYIKLEQNLKNPALLTIINHQPRNQRKGGHERTFRAHDESEGQQLDLLPLQCVLEIASSHKHKSSGVMSFAAHNSHLKS